jgi:DNA-binding MarR family transcriptional regulator
MTSPTTYRSLAEFRHQIRRFIAFSEQEARAAGLEPQQHQLLLAIKGLPEGLRPTIRVLADRLVLKHHSVVELIDRSVDAKLVARRPSDVDGRETLIHVTARGEQVLKKLTVAHRDELQTAGPLLLQALLPLVSAPTPPTRRAAARAS